MTAAPLEFRPFIGMGASYDSGLSGVAVDDNGQLGSQASFGERLEWGISGSHISKYTTVGLSYRGSVSRYQQHSTFDSVSLTQSLMLGVTRRISRHVTLSVNEAAGMFSRDFGLLGLPQTVPFDPSTAFIPTTDFFDNRTQYLTSQASLIVQKTARLSFSMGGGMNIVSRRSHSLYGTKGVGASGDVQYRLNRNTTIGAGYNYGYFKATGNFGGTDVHSAFGSLSRQFSRRLEFSGSGGAMHVESTFLRSVPVDPVIAALLGITGTSQIRHNVFWGARAEGRLSYVFPRGVAYASAARGVMPGNGLFLTSVADTYSAGYVYTGIRRWTFDTQISYARSTSIQNVEGGYNTLSGSMQVSRTLSRLGLHWFAGYSIRRYESPAFAAYNRTINQANIGLGYSPGDLPLRIW